MQQKPYYKYFNRKTRCNGEHFTCLEDNSPDELCQFVRHIHECLFNCGPNDWLYETIEESLCRLEEDSYDNISCEPDIYNHELTKWLYDNCNAFASDCCNEYLENSCCNSDILSIISCGQWVAKDRIYQEVQEFLDTQKKDA